MSDLFMIHHKDGTKMYYVRTEEIQELIDHCEDIYTTTDDAELYEHLIKSLENMIKVGGE